MGNVSELVEKLGELSVATKELYKQYKAAKELEDQARLELVQTLHDTGLDSAKTTDYTASITRKNSVVVTNEKQAIAWVQNNQDVETDQYIGLKITQFKTLVSALLKNTGEVIPGTELKEAESLSIRANKKKEVK